MFRHWKLRTLSILYVAVIRDAIRRGTVTTFIGWMSSWIRFSHSPNDFLIVPISGEITPDIFI